MITIYCQETSPRLEYILELMLGDLLGLKYEVTADADTFLSASGAKICYSDVEIDGLHIRPSEILYQKSLEPVDASFDLTTDHLILNNENYFDPFAASFYLVSRYEEYLPFKQDDHQRFPATESILYQYGKLKQPVVNEWALEVKDKLRELYPNLLFNPRKFEYLSTIDIDQAFKYKNKGFRRNAGGLLRDLFQGNMELVRERLRILKGKEEDPFNNYEWQSEIHKSKNTRVQYFVQVGDHGEFDKNLPVDNESFKEIIKALNKEQNVGIHPSYSSDSNPRIIKKEKESLESVIGDKVEVSRQHFLRMEMPETFQALIEAGIKEDHTLGYSTHLGFRAGIAAPFWFFDLSKNEKTDLRLVPFCMMDITPLHYIGQSVQEAKIELTQLINRIKKCGGLCSSLWHNESLSENGRWYGWRTVYEHVLAQGAAPNG